MCIKRSYAEVPAVTGKSPAWHLSKSPSPRQAHAQKVGREARNPEALDGPLKADNQLADNGVNVVTVLPNRETKNNLSPQHARLAVWCRTNALVQAAAGFPSSEGLVTSRRSQRCSCEDRLPSGRWVHGLLG